MAANNNSPSSSSHSHSHSLFKKIVELQDWWLTKPQTAADDDDDDETKTIGVSGLTCTSLKTRAGRCFSSAPIIKVDDIFELQTEDGVSVILRGFINKDRTLENGFPPEVFDHFVIGFPYNWKEFSTSCPKRESAANSISRGLIFPVNEDKKDSIEEQAEFHDNSHGKPVDIGAQDCEDTILSNKTNTASSLEIPHEHIIKAGHEVFCERSLMTPVFENGPTVRNAVDSSTGSKCLKVSSRRMTRSMAKMNSSKKNSPIIHDISNLDKVNLINPENLGSCDTLKMDKNDTLSNNKAVNVVDRDLKSESRKTISKNSEKGSNETANCSEDVVLRMKSKRKQNDQNVDVTEDSRNQVGISNQGKNKDADVSGESEIDTTRSDLEAKRSKSECSNPSSSTDEFNFASSEIDVNDDLVHLRTLMKACKIKKKNREGVAARIGIDSKKAIITRSKSKSKLTPGNSNCKMTKKQVITSPKSPPSRAKKGSKEEHGSFNILSPESFSGKKSRSGRVLLPTLQFWRNQKVVYDEDGELCGVQEPK